jgi:tRNA (guanine-N7-)-methyltransferase
MEYYPVYWIKSEPGLINQRRHSVLPDSYLNGVSFTSYSHSSFFYFCLMGQKKLQRFGELKTFSNVLEYPENMQGQWQHFFKNDNPLVLELACGKGEYAVGLGRLHPHKNFIGIDIKGNRMWVGAKTALHDGLHNVAFVRTQIQKLTEYFAAGEVSEIWITFPDPQLRNGKAKKRLTHPRFLRLYKTILAEGGMINLKTDSPDLYDFTKQVISLFGLHLVTDDEDVYARENIGDDLLIKTHYEGLDIAGSNRIHYLRFELDKPMPEELDEQLKALVSEEAVDRG